MKEVTANQLEMSMRDSAQAFAEAITRAIKRGCSIGLDGSDARREFTVVCLMDQSADRKITRPRESAVPLHPLQRMSSQPSAFGQSMWKPWENGK